MPTPLTDADKVLRNDVGKRMAVALEAIAEGSGGSAKIEEMTQAEYDALTPAQKADGTLRAISDGETKIEDIDNVNITTSDNGKLLGVSVSSGDISVDAVGLTAADIPYSAGVSVADKLDSLSTMIKIISNEPWSTETPIATDTELNSSSPVSITGIPSGYTVIGISNVRVRGYFGSRGVAYAWLEDSTHFGYSIYNAANREIKVILTVSFICVKT